MLRVLIFSFVLLLICSEAYCTSAKKGKIQFIISNRDSLIESEGLRFKGLRDSKPAPSPSPRTNMLYNPENPSDTFACYDLHEMWMADQFVGKWENEAGSISVYKLNLPVPEGLLLYINKFVKKNDYEKWLEKNKSQPEGIDSKEWIDFFTEGRTEGEPEIFKTSLVQKTVHYKVKPEERYRDMYMVTDLRTPEQRTFLFVYEVEGTTDFKQSGGAIQQSIQSVGFQNIRETEAKQMVTKASTAINKNKQEYSDEYFADRQRILNNIKNLKGWWFLDTANYIIISDIKDKRAILDIEKNIEKARSAYKIIFPVKKPINSASVIKIFADRSEYVSYLGRNSSFAWSAGFWDYSKKELAISPIEGGGNKAQEINKRLLEVMFHEAFHQYIYYASNGMQTSPWFNEGCASFFEGLKILPGKENNFAVEYSQHMTPFLELVKRRQINIEDLLNIKTYDDFYNQDMLETNYAMAWGLMYFLFKGAPMTKNGKEYSEIPSKYYDAVLETGDSEKASAAAWKDIDIKKFNVDFNSFWNTQASINRSKAVNPFEKGKKKAE